MIKGFTSVDIRVRFRNKVISFCYFCFLGVPLTFSLFASFIFFFFMSAACKKKKEIFHLVTFSNHISSIKKQKKKD